MVITMLAGGAAYDLIFMRRVASLVGVDFHFTQDWTLRFPIYLTLSTALPPSSSPSACASQCDPPFPHAQQLLLPNHRIAGGELRNHRRSLRRAGHRDLADRAVDGSQEFAAKELSFNRKHGVN